MVKSSTLAVRSTPSGVYLEVKNEKYITIYSEGKYSKNYGI